MDNNLNFFSVSSDGRIVSWTLLKVPVSQKGSERVEKGRGGIAMGCLLPGGHSPTHGPSPIPFDGRASWFTRMSSS